MENFFIPLIIACGPVVDNPQSDCRAFVGSVFEKKEECVFDLHSKGLPFVKQALPEGGTIADSICIPSEIPSGVTAEK